MKGAAFPIAGAALPPPRLLIERLPFSTLASAVPVVPVDIGHFQCVLVNGIWGRESRRIVATPDHVDAARDSKGQTVEVERPNL
jgi:hypothetical protein